MTSMNSFTVESPRGDFTGESVGVHFHKGVGRVDDGSKEGRAAIEYFRRQGYTLTPESAEADEPAPAQAVEPEAGPFDPTDHDVADVLAYLDTLDAEDADDAAEAERVIAAERDGKARKTILARGEQQKEEQQ